MRSALILVAVGVGVMGLLALTTQPFSPDQFCCDQLFYRSMAYNLVHVTRPDLNVAPPHNRLSSVYRAPYFSRFMNPRDGLNRQPPYVYRILTPVLARGLTLVAPLSIDEAFRVTTFIGLVMAIVLTGICVWDLSGSVEFGVLAQLCFASVSPLVRFNLYDYMLVDAMAMGLLMAGIWALIKHRRGWFILIVAIGVLDKESLLLLLPAAILLDVLRREFDWRWVAAYCSVGAIYLGERLLIHVPVNTYGLGTAFIPHSIPVIALATAGLLGPLLPLAAVRGWQRPETAVLIPVALAMVGFVIFVSDVSRTIAMAVPILILLSLTPRVDSWRATAVTLAAAFSFIAAQRLHAPILWTAVGAAAVIPELLGRPRTQPVGTGGERD